MGNDTFYFPLFCNVPLAAYFYNVEVKCVMVTGDFVDGIHRCYKYLFQVHCVGLYEVIALVCS